jgi:DNA-binding MarR family transcriptional regulator
MTKDIRDNVANSLLALMPLYHRHILKASTGTSGIQIAQYRMLGQLMKAGPLSMSEIGRYLYISKPSMTSLADSMTANGWIEQNNDPNDRRVKKISITSQGKKHLQQAFEIYHGDVKNLLLNLDDSDLQGLSLSLENIQRIFEKLE